MVSGAAACRAGRNRTPPRARSECGSNVGNSITRTCTVASDQGLAINLHLPQVGTGMGDDGYI
eukprot:1000427-Pyramimonas_sp.AAC.1